jgi:hypothetical protein
VLSAVIVLLSTIVLACPPAAVYLLVTGDPQWERYGLLWALAALSPFVAAGVVRWFARTRAALAARWVRIRAAGLLLFHVVTGCFALADNGSGPLMLVPVSFVTLAGWVVGWKIIDLGRPPHRAAPTFPPVHQRVWTTTVRTERTPPKADPQPRPGDIYWADVPLDDGSGDRRRPCVVVRSYRSHAYVLGISHSRRGDTLRLDPDGWSRDRRPSHVQLDPLHKLRYNRFGARMGRCPGTAWNEILYGYPPQGDPTTPRRIRPVPVREEPARRQPPPQQARRQPPPEPARSPGNHAAGHGTHTARRPAAPVPPSDGVPRRRAGNAATAEPPPATSDGVPRRRHPA